jgi:hypothetical protein
MGTLGDVREAVSKKIEKILQKLPAKIADNMIVAWFIAQNTLTVVLMAMFVMAPVVIYPFLLGWPAPYCYVAYAFWITLLIGSLVAAAIIGYLRETQGERMR